MLTEQQKEDLRLQQLWTKRKTQTSFAIFKSHYLSLDKRCFYCGITEADIKSLIDEGKLTTKRIKTRGIRLELDRKQAELPYDNLDNIVLSCYWCNNAKTDTFSKDEFLEVGKVISKIWQRRIAS